MASFSLNEEKLLPDDAKLISWCPTTDLVLIVSSENSLSLYRNGTTRVWLLEDQFSSNITVLAWNPNGRECVLGCEDGVVHKLDITPHTPVISTCWESNTAILSLEWTNYAFKKKNVIIEEFDDSSFDLEAALPPLSDEPPAEPKFRMPFRQKKTQLPKKPSITAQAQTLLFVGDQRGKIHIILNGIYHVGSVDLEIHSDEELDTLCLSIVNNASSLQILTKAKSSSFDYVFYTLDTHILNDRKEEIYSISEIQTQLNYLLQYTQCTMEVLKKHHDAYAEFTSSIAKQASYYILNHDDQAEAMPEVDLFGTLATGKVTETLHEFFAEYLNSQRIKQWESAVSYGHQSSLSIICEYILPVCDRIQLQLSKLLGLSLWTQRYGDLLEPDAVETCIKSARELLSATLKFSKVLGPLSNSFQAFIKWISDISQRVYDPASIDSDAQPNLCQEPQLVAKFLEKDFVQDSVKSYFEMMQENSLVQILSTLTAQCTEMLSRPSKTISTQVHTASVLPIHLPSMQIQSKIVSHTVLDVNPQLIYYAILQTVPETQLILIRKSAEESTVQQAAYKVIGAITDLEFFDKDELAVLVQIDEANTKLQTVALSDVKFTDIGNTELAHTELEASRSLMLNRMIRVKIGCNGLPRRRIFSVVASNGLMKVYFMDEDEEDEDDEEEEEEEEDD